MTRQERQRRRSSPLERTVLPCHGVDSDNLCNNRTKDAIVPTDAEVRRHGAYT